MEDTEDRIPRAVWRISFVVVIGSIMSILDTTIVNVAIDTPRCPRCSGSPPGTCWPWRP